MDHCFVVFKTFLIDTNCFLPPKRDKLKGAENKDKVLIEVGYSLFFLAC